MTTPLPPTGGALTREDAAQYLGVSLAMLDQLRAAGRLDPIELEGSPRMQRYLRADLDDYLHAQPRRSERSA